MSFKIKIALITTVIAAIIVAFFVYYYFLYNPRVNYLIPGVPYYGFYNNFLGTRSPMIASVADILHYWGDERFYLTDIKQRFSASPQFKDFISTPQIADFFQANGYQIFSWNSNKSGSEIDQLKKFINENKKIPVIIFQKHSFLPEEKAGTFRVVIGIFDDKKTIIVHDYDFGNNFEISYDDFNKLFLPGTRSMLAIWPGKDLQNTIKGPNYQKAYPERLTLMTELVGYSFKIDTAEWFFYNRNYAAAVQSLTELINQNEFNYLPALYKTYFYTLLSRAYLFLNQTDKAIEVLTQKAIPLNHDLNQPDNGWVEQLNYFRNYKEAKLTAPYYYLGRAYQIKGEKKLAKENFEKALEIYQGSLRAQRAIDNLAKSAK